MQNLHNGFTQKSLRNKQIFDKKSQNFHFHQNFSKSTGHFSVKKSLNSYFGVIFVEKLKSKLVNFEKHFQQNFISAIFDNLIRLQLFFMIHRDSRTRIFRVLKTAFLFEQPINCQNIPNIPIFVSKWYLKSCTSESVKILTFE